MKDVYAKTEKLYAKHIAQVEALPEEQRAYYTHLWTAPKDGAPKRKRRARKAKVVKAEKPAKSRDLVTPIPKPKKPRGHVGRPSNAEIAARRNAMVPPTREQAEAAAGAEA